MAHEYKCWPNIRFQSKSTCLVAKISMNMGLTPFYSMDLYDRRQVYRTLISKLFIGQTTVSASMRGGLKLK